LLAAFSNFMSSNRVTVAKNLTLSIQPPASLDPPFEFEGIEFEVIGCFSFLLPDKLRPYIPKQVDGHFRIMKVQRVRDYFRGFVVLGEPLWGYDSLYLECTRISPDPATAVCSVCGELLASTPEMSFPGRNYFDMVCLIDNDVYHMDCAAAIGYKRLTDHYPACLETWMKGYAPLFEATDYACPVAVPVGHLLENPIVDTSLTPSMHSWEDMVMFLREGTSLKDFAEHQYRFLLPYLQLCSLNPFTTEELASIVRDGFVLIWVHRQRRGVKRSPHLESGFADVH
jgi:hypothetical protein